MEILNESVREATRKKFESEMTGKVSLIYYAQEPSRLVLPGGPTGNECFFCRETRQLLEEVKAQSEKIELITYDFQADKAKAAEDGVDMIPAILVRGEKANGIRFFGIPSGYEYTSLIEAIIDVSRGGTGLAEKTKEALRAVDKPVHIRVFVTPTCPYCSIPVRLAHQFALESPFVIADMIESTEFPHLANRYNVRGVPKTVVNDTVSFEGGVPEEVFLENVLKAVSAPEAASK
jgi:glutaredoxin-like protein